VKRVILPVLFLVSFVGAWWLYDATKNGIGIVFPAIIVVLWFGSGKKGKKV